MSKKAKPSTEGGRLQRNNVYTGDSIRDWAGRIHAGPGGIKMNEKFMLVAMAGSVSATGFCELPVRYLADYIGVGLRQAQRIIQKLSQYELIHCYETPSEGRVNNIVRKFKFNSTIDADEFSPKDSAELPLMRHIRQEFNDRLMAALAGGKISDFDFLSLGQAHLVVVRSKQLDFVSPNAEVTDTVFRYKKFLLDLVSEITKSEVLRLHMFPKKGYRG